MSECLVVCVIMTGKQLTQDRTGTPDVAKLVNSIELLVCVARIVDK